MSRDIEGKSEIAQVAAISANNDPEIGQIIAQAAAQANSQGAAATIAVVDRVGNVLGVFRMPGAPLTARVSEAPNGDNIDIQGLDVPSEAAAIAKALFERGTSICAERGVILVDTKYEIDAASAEHRARLEQLREQS